MVSGSMDILICDARLGEPILRPFTLLIPPDGPVNVGLALVQAGIAKGPEDPVLGRKGCLAYLAKGRSGIALFIQETA